MKTYAKMLSWTLLLCVLAFGLAPVPVQAAQDREWVTYNLPAGVCPTAVVTVGSLVYVGSNDGLYKGTGDDWAKVDTGSVSLGRVWGLAYDPVGQKMYVSDPDHTRVLVWNMADNTWGRFTHRDFDSRGISVYRDGDQYRVYVAECSDHDVFEFRGAGGYGSISTDADPVGSMNQPYEAVRHEDTLYVADRVNDRILMRDADLNWSEIVHPTYTEDASDMAVLTDGTLYFSQYYQDRVMKYADGHYTIVMAGSSLLSGPWGVYGDEWDNLFICDRLNERILRSKDDNNRLKGISVNTALLPGFSPDTYEYFLTYENRIESIDLDAWAESPYAAVSGAGTKDLDVGENDFTITVHPETGEDRDYCLHVTREAPPTPAATPNPAFTAELTADTDTIEVGETVTFTLTLVNTGDVGFTDMDAANMISTEHAFADLMLGVGETRTEEITVTAGEEDMEGGIRLAYDVTGRTAMGYEMDVSTGTCVVSVSGDASEPSGTAGDEEADAAAAGTPENTASPDASVSPDSAGAALDLAEEQGNVSNGLLWAGGATLLLLLISVIVLLIILLRQKKKRPGDQTAAEAPAAAPDTAGEEVLNGEQREDTDAEEDKEVKDKEE